MHLQVTKLDFNKPLAPQYRHKNTEDTPQITTLKLINFVLFNRSAPNLQSAFAAIPETVTTLDISYNRLGQDHPGENLALAISALPLTVTELSLNLNKMNLLQATGLGLVLQAFSGTTLHLENNDLGQLSGEALSSAFTHMAPNVTQLNLSDNHLDILKTTDLQSTYSSIPVTVTYLDLSWNNLGNFPNKDLALIFASIPKGVKTLNFNGNNLEDRTET